MTTTTKYQIVIGLEVHAQLSTKTKLFCACSTEFGKEPNHNTCPICMGYPGVLPVLNATAVEYATRAGLALGCTIDGQSKFDRKQYFYPDLPKGYQISQWDRPICSNGELVIEFEDDTGTKSLPEKRPDARHASPSKREFIFEKANADELAQSAEPNKNKANALLDVNEHCEGEHNNADGTFRIGSKQTKRVGIHRIHMEEDAGKLVHASDTADARLHGSDYSLVDLNRAGTPLIEIVSDPDIRSAAEAVAYVKELRKILMAIGVCDGNMQEGSLRCDVNISLHLPGTPYGTRAEIKNVNSFRSISRAIEYEYRRQSELLDQGKTIDQETRLFEENSGKTFTMRSKEDAHDYRYFPEPDLVPMNISTKQIEATRAALPELPQQKLNRYIQEFALNEEAASTLIDEMELALFFEATLVETASKQPVKIANYLIGQVAGYLNENKISLAQTKLTPKLLAEMVLAIDQGIISDNIAKNDIILELLTQGTSVAKLIETKGLAQITDTGAIEAIVKKIIDSNQKQLADYKAGNAKLKGFFVGQVMKETQGKASPQIINELLEKFLA